MQHSGGVKLWQINCLSFSKDKLQKLKHLTTLATDHLHVRTKEFINTLIVVTSPMDAVGVSMNVLNPMDNQ